VATEVDDKSPVTLWGPKTWSVPSVEFGFFQPEMQNKSVGGGSGQVKKNWTQVESDAESVGSGTGGWRQKVSALGGNPGAPKGADGYLKRFPRA